MRKVSLFLILAAVIVAGSFTRPAAAIELAEDKAAEVIAAMRKAIGGGKLESLKTFSLEAKTARNVGARQLTSDVELYLEIPDKYLRVENITAPMAMSISTGFNGDKVIRPSGGPMGGAPMMIMNGGDMGGRGGGGAHTMIVTTRMGAEMGAGGASGGAAAPTPEQQAMMNTAMLRSQRVELTRYMLGWFGMAHPGLNATYTYAGEAESPDGKAHIIDVKADGGFAVKLFVDQATSMPLMVSYQAPEPRIVTTRGGGPGAPAGAPVVPAAGTPPKMVEHRLFFTDWKDVDGIQFPHTLQRAMAGTTTEEWTIAKVRVNPKIDAKKFSTQ